MINKAIGKYIEQNTRKAFMLSKRYESRNSYTYLGGTPTLPAGMEWPIEEETNRPLRFLAQLDLSELSGIVPEECPINGALFFFCGPELDYDVGSSNCVLYSPTGTGNSQIAPPRDLIPDYQGGWDGFYRSSRFNPLPMVQYPKYEVDLIPFQDIRVPDYREVKYYAENAWDTISEIAKAQKEQAMKLHYGDEYKNREERSYISYEHRRIYEPTWISRPVVVHGALPDVSPLLRKWPQCGIFIALHLNGLLNPQGNFYRSTEDCEYRIKFLDECKEWIAWAEDNGLFNKINATDRAKYRKWLSDTYMNCHDKGRCKEDPLRHTYFGIQHGLENSLRFSALNGFSRCVDLNQTNRALFTEEELADYASQLKPQHPHQLFGYGTNIQNAAHENEDKILLLQLSTDYPMFLMFGDCGVIQYWISKQDLLAKNFRNVQVTLEGC